MAAKIGQKRHYCYLKVKNEVKVVLPLKQGLKPAEAVTILFSGIVKVVLPLKQGLKLVKHIFIYRISRVKVVLPLKQG